MDFVTLDFETYYDKDYSLRKLTTEEYIRDRRFEVIGVAVKVNNRETEWISGTHKHIKTQLQALNLDEAMVLAHNTMFDGAILSWRYGIRPRAYADTLCMSRAIHGVEDSASLKALVGRYDIGTKGTEVAAAIGKYRTDFTDSELARYGAYCVNDVDLAYELFKRMSAGFPRKELKLIDLTLRMYIEPTLDLDMGLLEGHLAYTKNIKDNLLRDANIERADLMSNPKFADILRAFDVEPPMKVSPTTGKETFAFAKSDEAFKALTEHADVRVQTAVTARLGVKSTLEETRTQRFIDIAKRGLLPVPVRYYAAHTGRWGGDDKINLQNLPSRGPNAKALKRSIVAPDGYTIVEADSSQIEARVLAWLAEQEDLVTAFTNKEDVYKQMASRIYGVDEEDVNKDQRFVGKTTILGAGYGMGAVRFKEQLKNFGFDMDLDEARRVIDIYRNANSQIHRLWRDAQNTIATLDRGDATPLGVGDLIESVPDESALRLPSGLLLRYSDLSAEQTDKGYEYSYRTRRGRTRIYGGKVVENVCQAIARCIIGEQMLEVARRYKVVLTVHDSIVCCVPDADVEEAKIYVEQCMRAVPDWAKGLPVDCEAGVGKSYGDCE
jgi:DNA polymerase I-like protein with 3'-5' exonuclease and polymerase domains|tara:strand:+ start:2587 stop:4413 length:1827 start_codon:yes stop_codon:yes gene_type:complete